VDWVYSAARRRTGDDELSQDIAQAVFITLAQSPPRRWTLPSLSPWLFGVLIRTCKAALRAQQTRRRHELEAAKMRNEAIESPVHAEWTDIAPHLEEMVLKLRASDREIVLLRFYEQKSFVEIAGLIGISEDAARKRVSRSVEALRGMLSRRGVSMPAAGLVGILSLNVASPAPAALASTIAVAEATSSARVLLQAVAWTKAKSLAVMALVGAMLLAGGTAAIIAVAQLHSPSVASVPVSRPPMPVPEETDKVWKGDVPKPWYYIVQPDYQGILLHGMPQRLAIAYPPGAGAPTMGNQTGNGRLELNVMADSAADNAITIGLFTDPAWSAPPVYVAHLSGVGRHELTDLPVGKYHIGAMIASSDRPTAVGMDSSWPSPIEIKADLSAATFVYLFAAASNAEGNQPGDYTGWPIDRSKLNEKNLVMLHVIDDVGKPVPFARVTFTAWTVAMRRDGGFLYASTDEQGNAYTDRIRDGSSFLISVARYQSDPPKMLEFSMSQHFSRTYVKDGPMSLEVRMDPLPVGLTTVAGRVHDQFGRGLREFWATATYRAGDPTGVGDSTLAFWHVPVITPDGLFEIPDLPPGQFKIRPRAFDYTTHADIEGVDLMIPNPPPPRLEVDVAMEAKMLYYGRALYTEGTPVANGSWVARFTAQDDPTTSHFSYWIDPDGSFRVSLSKIEREMLTRNFDGLILITDAFGAIGSVRYTDLGTSRATPKELYFERPTTRPAGSAGR
jgi:RNA polymerase sigma factor (sigma-70 family)